MGSHEVDGLLFKALFEKPGFREQLLEYLGTSYDEILDPKRLVIPTQASDSLTSKNILISHLHVVG
jgi:hypothetical protein